MLGVQAETRLEVPFLDTMNPAKRASQGSLGRFSLPLSSGTIWHSMSEFSVADSISGGSGGREGPFAKFLFSKLSYEGKH